MSEKATAANEGARRAWQGAASLLALGALVWLLRPGALLERLVALDLRFALAAVLCAVLEFFVLAARWRFVARCLGLPLGFAAALAEYFLSALLNQVVPSGIAGDALRAVRHARQVERDSGESETRRVVLALLLDRASGQLALWLFALAALRGWWPVIAAHIRSPGPLAVALAALLAASALLLVAFARARWGKLRDLSSDAMRALFAPRNLIVHLPLSALLVSMHVAVFCLCAFALGSPLDLSSALKVVPVLLLVSTLPAFFAGFGVREAAAAGLYQLLGLPAAEGAVVALVFGLVGVVASAPGIYALWRRR